MDFLTNIISRFSATAWVTQADCTRDQHQKLLGIIPKWYEYLSYTPAPRPVNSCSVSLSLLKNVADKTVKVHQNAFSSVLLIGLAILDMLIHIAGVIAIGFVVYGGIQYVLSQGEPDRLEKAKSTLTNALIGLVIVIIAIPIVAFIGRTLG